MQNSEKLYGLAFGCPDIVRFGNCGTATFDWTVG